MQQETAFYLKSNLSVCGDPLCKFQALVTGSYTEGTRT